MRHGIAAEHGDPRYPKDSDRPLTSEGEKKVKIISDAMKKLEISFDSILTSPYVRAAETAKIVAKTFKKEVTFSEELRAEQNSEHLVEMLRREYKQDASLLLVGHEPLLSHWISVLVSGNPHTEILMKKAGVCKLSVGNLHYGRCATLEWLLAPRHFLAIKD